MCSRRSGRRQVVGCSHIRSLTSRFLGTAASSRQPHRLQHHSVISVISVLSRLSNHSRTDETCGGFSLFYFGASESILWLPKELWDSFSYRLQATSTMSWYAFALSMATDRSTCKPAVLINTSDSKVVSQSVADIAVACLKVGQRLMFGNTSNLRESVTKSPCFLDRPPSESEDYIPIEPEYQSLTSSEKTVP